MTKLLKIICVTCWLWMYHLRSEKYNVITVSRETTAVNYDKLAPDEICLVFEQLATLIPAEPIKEAKEGDPSTKLPLTIVVFNEAFFGQYEPLSKEDVNGIIEIYRSFQHRIGNSCFYVNFLYKDELNPECEKQITQIRNSIERYSKEITTEAPDIKFPSFYVEGEEISTETFKDGPKFGQSLLFNQTKIFHGINEIGCYNKSSFCNEYDKFCTEKPYYVIGNFNTIYWTEPPLQMNCLTCYDIDAVSNECYRRYMEEKSIFAFSSNSSSSLPCALFGIYGNLASKKILFICSDSYEDEVTAPIDCKGQDESCLKCLRGVFEYEGSILSPQNASKIHKVSSLQKEDTFIFKFFNLTKE